jgi:hypothetical protein
MLMKLVFLTDTRKKFQTSKSKKTRPVGAEMLRTDRRRKRTTKLIVAFRDFANAHKDVKKAKVIAMILLTVSF